MKIPALYCLLLCLSGLLSCQRDARPLVVKLDKVIYNSYHKTLPGRNIIKLAANETVTYYKGRQKVSTRSANVEFQETKFRISLVDANQDGVFNTAGTDLIALSIYGQDTVTLDPREAHVDHLRQRTFIQIDRQFFLVDLLAESGEELTLVPWDRPPSDAIAAVGKTYLTKFSVLDIKGEESYLSWSQGDRPRLLLFWNLSSAKGVKLLEAADQLKESWQERLELVTFCMNDFHAFLEGIDLPHLPIYYATNKTCKTINCHAHFPYGILIDKNGQILQSDLSPAAIIDILKGGTVISSR